MSKEKKALIHNGQNDFTLTGPSAWISVGPFSVYIRTDGSGPIVDIYRMGEETEKPVSVASYDGK